MAEVLAKTSEAARRNILGEQRAHAPFDDEARAWHNVAMIDKAREVSDARDAAIDPEHAKLRRMGFDALKRAGDASKPKEN